MQSLRLSKSKFFERLDRQSKRKYGSGFSESWYETLRDEGLALRFDRGANDGTSPTYFATWRHYRRALQLKRLHCVGITSSDAQWVQLFLRGYGVSAPMIREALRREVIRTIAKLRPKLRSGYFQNSREVGHRHFASLAKQLGPLDPRLEAIGLRQPSELYLQIARNAFGVKSRNLEDMIGGLLNAVEGCEALPPLLEKALNSDPEIYTKVRIVFRETDRLLFKRIFGAELTNSPEFAVCAFVSMLVAENGGFSLSEIFYSLPAPEGFERLYLSLCDAVIEEAKK